MKIYTALTVLLIGFHAIGEPCPAQSAGKLRLPVAVNVFTTPSADSYIIDSLEPDTEIRILETAGSWLKIAIPRERKVWIASCFLKDGIITEKAVFRLGPSTAFPAVLCEKSFAGKKAEIAETDKTGFWKRIRMAEGLAGYIRAELASPDVKSGGKKNDGMFRDFSDVSMEGRLVPLEKKLGEAGYQLIFRVNETEYRMAYVIPGKADLRLWEGKTIRIQGRGFWESGIRHPFIKAGKIEPVRR